MNKQQKESLSALLDGEGDRQETSEMLGQLGQAPELEATMARYSLIGQALRGEAVHQQALDIHVRVSQRLAEEPTVLAPTPRGRSTPSEHWWRPVAGIAIAASVAALAVVFAPGLMQTPGGASSPGIASTQAPLAATPVRMEVSEGTRWTDGQPAVEDKLNDYLADHSEFGIQGGAPSLIPYASFVSYDGNR